MVWSIWLNTTGSNLLMLTGGISSSWSSSVPARGSQKTSPGPCRQVNSLTNHLSGGAGGLLVSRMPDGDLDLSGGVCGVVCSYGKALPRTATSWLSASMTWGCGIVVAAIPANALPWVTF